MIVPQSTFHRFKRWELFQFMYEVLAFIEENADDMPETFKSKAAELRTAFDIFDIEIVNDRTYSVKNLIEVEELRNYAIRKIYEVIRTYSNYTFSSEKEIAASRLQAVLKRYGTGRKISRMSQNEKTALLTNLLQDLSEPNMKQHLAILHLTDAVGALITHNQTFEIEQRNRVSANAEYVTGVVKEARMNVQNSFFEFVDLMNALAILEGQEKYAALKQSLTALLKKYVAQVRQRTRKKEEEVEEEGEEEEV